MTALVVAVVIGGGLWALYALWDRRRPCRLCPMPATHRVDCLCDRHFEVERYRRVVEARGMLVDDPAEARSPMDDRGAPRL